MKVQITMTEGLLGTKAGNPELLEAYIASKHPEAVQQDEMDTMPDLDEELANGSTFFNRDEDETPFIFDYQIKGFFKDAQASLQRVPGGKLPAYKKIIDGLIFIQPRRIRLAVPEGAELTICQRPLRAQTAQGERVSIARSEEAPVGTTITFEIVLLDKKLEKLVRKWFDYGEWRGLGQWRNSGKGRFTWKEIEG